MGFFECCHHCPSTKRHPGCHSKCEDYIKQKAIWEARRKVEKEARHRESQVRPAKTDYLRNAVWHKKRY